MQDIYYAMHIECDSRFLSGNGENGSCAHCNPDSDQYPYGLCFLMGAIIRNNRRGICVPYGVAVPAGV